MEAPSYDLYPVLRLQQLGSIVVVQPQARGAAAGPSLTCDLETGTLALAEHPQVDKDFIVVFGVLGMAKLEAGPVLVVITGVEQVAVVRGYPVYRVASTQVLADTRNGRWKAVDHEYLRLLRAGTDPAAHGGSLYFGHGGDLTLSHQRQEDAAGEAGYASKEPWQRAEPAFFWNAALAKPLLEAGMGRFVPPAFMGFVGQLAGLEFAGPAGRRLTATLTLIARRSVHRVGCRQWRRGIDLQGNVANFVESEQVFEEEGGPVRASFVQVRGSVPVLWSQAPNLKYKIPIRIAPPARTDPVFEGHAKALMAAYQECVGINLANQTGREGKLSAAYFEAAARAAPAAPGFRLVPFDFHKQCGATNYARLGILWGDIAPDFERFGAWVRGGPGGAAGRQGGVFRTNCVDTLDRTNVVQGLLGRKALEALLVRLGLASSGVTLAQAFPQVDQCFRVMWADHGDEISRQYAGTGAMKSAFTRTGKRDIWGLLDDGAKSLTRYYLNNFRDGEKQDALDLVTGSAAAVPGRKSPFKPQGSPALPLLAALALLALAWRNAAALLRAGGGVLAQAGPLVREVLSLVLVAVVILGLVQKNGKHLVNVPRLRPDLASPWSRK